MKPSKTLLPKYTILIISIIVLLVCSQITISYYLKTFENDGRLINLAGRQRMLSQQIMKEKLILANEGKIQSHQLDSIIQLFTNVHKNLLLGNPQLQIKPLDKRLKAKFSNVNKSFSAFINAINFLDNKANYKEQNIKQQQFLQAMDEFVFAADILNEKKIQDFRLLQLLLAIGSILIIALEVIFIFLPSFNKQLQQQTILQKINYSDSHIVRQPLANLIGLLSVLKKDNLSTKQQEYLKLIETEAQKLDDALHHNANINRE